MPRLLNLGCGPMARDGFINADRLPLDGVDLRCDLARGLPIADESLDGIVAIHVLQDLEWAAQRPALGELLRTLRRGGVLRVAVPDLERAVDAYRRDDASWFYVPDRDARSPAAKLVTQLTWYGSVRTPFTFGFLAEWLAQAGFRSIGRSAFGCTGSGLPILASLDNRARESLFVEACR